MDSVLFLILFLALILVPKSSAGPPCQVYGAVTRCYNVEILDLASSLQAIEESLALEVTSSNFPVLGGEAFRARRDWEALYLPRNGIADILTDAFSGLGKVLSINLEGNRLSKMDPRTFSYCYSLDKLILSHNPLTIDEEAAFLDANQLAYLDISFANITNLPLNTFQLLRRLGYLNIAHNLIEVLDSEVFAHLLQLKVLDVTGNRFVVIDHMIFSKNSLTQLSNEWNCDCDFKVVFYEVFENATLAPDALRCSENTAWMDMEALNCDNHVPNKMLYNNLEEYRTATGVGKKDSTPKESVVPPEILLVVVFSVLVILVILLLVLIYWFRMKKGSIWEDAPNARTSSTERCIKKNDHFKLCKKNVIS